MKLFKIVLIALFPLVSFANDKRHEKSKTLHKTYNVNSDATVVLNNKYGNINITTWDQNTVDITVKITVKGSKLDRVEEKLNNIDVYFSGTQSQVEARTSIEKTSKGWSFFGNNNNNLNFKINYIVKMPKTNNTQLRNKYGSINLDELSGKAEVSCSYGSIDIDKLHHPSNIIKLKYCSTSEIDFAENLDVNIDYSKLKIKETNRIIVNSDYSTTTVDKAKDIDFNCDYGGMRIGTAEKIIGNSDYTGIKIGTVLKSADLNTDFGGIKIGNLANGFDKLIVNGSYAGIKIGTSESNNFNFNLNLSYAGFSYPDEAVEMYKSIKKTTKKYYEGKFGNGNSNAKVDIKSEYGSVSLKIND